MSNLDFIPTLSAMAGPGTTTFTSPALTETSRIGRLGLPVSAMQKILRGAAGSNGNNGHGERFSEPAQRPEKPLIGLGLGLPTDEMHSSFRVQPKIGLGIYISGWEVVDDREDEDEDEVEAAPSLPSPPLLPTRRESPFRIDVIVDDDEFPPSHSIFTPPVPETSEEEMEEYPFRRTFIRPAFMCAPSASELPNPYSYNRNKTSQELSQSSDEADQPCDAAVASSSGEEVEDDAGKFVEPGSPRTPLVFQPFTPVPEDDAGCAYPFTSEREETCDESVLIRLPHVPHVFSPAPLTSLEADAYFHLPSNLFVSPKPVANGCMGFGTIYETPATLCF